MQTGLEPNVQLNQPLPNVANVQDLSKHPVYVRTGNSGSFYDGIDFRYVPYWSATGGTAGSPPLQTVRDGRLGDRLINTNYHDFAPRIGIAYSPSDKWSIRAGFGIFYSQESKNSIFDLARGMGGRATTLAPTTYGVPTFSYTNFIDTASLPVTVPVGLTWGANPAPAGHFQHAIRAERAALARQIDNHWRWVTAARRAATWHYLANENQGILNAALPAVQRLPYPEWGASGIQYLIADATGSYNALSAKFTQRFGNSLNTLLSYTWSKSLDTPATSAARWAATSRPRMRAAPIRCEKGPSDFNIPQRFVASILYTLPFGKGQKFLNHGGVVNQVVGGWQLSTITTLQSGGVGQHVLVGFRGHQFHFERHPAQLRFRRGPGSAQ